MGVKSLVWEALDDIKIAWQYYRVWRFCRADLSLKRSYLSTPTAVLCRWALKELDDDQVQRTYGETSILQFAHLLVQADIACGTGVQFYELGCGRGRLAFWLGCTQGCDVTGVDLNPVFIERAQSLSTKLRLPNVEFMEANLMTLDYKDADVVYVYGTGFSDQAIHTLKRALLSVPVGAVIITISYSLNELKTPDVSHDAFELCLELPIEFVWGLTTAYVHRRS